ncbi:MAG TPA: DinB family protein [Pyrinomonadaceae bacterium]|nr:DinB family protein [Pyrinomonadaceae bacterium]
MSDNDKQLRDHLLSLLDGGNAHITFDDFVKDFPADKCGEHVDGLPYTAWQVLEHMRIAQWDILEFTRDPNHVSPKWPEGYWPPQNETGNADVWKDSVAKFHKDLKEMQDLIADPATDLLAKIPHGSGQTVLREALLLADHNSYHLGVLLAISRLLTAK